MREAIERVIAELEVKQLASDDARYAANDLQIKEWNDGYGEGIEAALDLLKVVLANGENAND